MKDDILIFSFKEYLRLDWLIFFLSNYEINIFFILKENLYDFLLYLLKNICHAFFIIPLLSLDVTNCLKE